MAPPPKILVRIGSADTRFHRGRGGAFLSAAVFGPLPCFFPASAPPGLAGCLRTPALAGVKVLMTFGGFVITEFAYPSRRAYLCDSIRREGR